MEPSPWTSQRAHRARMDILDDRIAGEKAACERADQGRGWHRRRRRQTPTSLTLREQICSPVQRRSRDEMAIQHDPPG